MTNPIKYFLASLAGVALAVSAPDARAADIDIFEGATGLTGTNSWWATNTYHLQGLIHLRSNAVLNIEAGTVVKGVNLGAAAIQKGGLVVSRGAKIFAQGTAAKPIIFTAEDDDVEDPTDLDIYQRGLWGGVVIMGQARINAATTAAGNAANPKYEVFEGLPDTNLGGDFVNRYGGANDNDSSGVLRYVSIRHGGAVIEANKELNGLSICAAGRRTVLEYIEAFAIADDGFEFFGGTANSKYLVSAFNDDDCFDADQGYSGKNQFWFALQAPDRRNYGMELNGEPNGLTGATPLEPYSNFQVYNATLIGAGTASIGVGGDNTALKIREYSAPRLYNSIITDFARRGIEIDAKSGVMETNGLLQLCNNLWWGFGTSADPNSVTNICVDARAQYYFTNAAWANLILNPMLVSISRTNNGGLDPRPLASSPAYTGAGAVPLDGFFTPVCYQGAFGSDCLWTDGWTALAAYGVTPATVAPIYVSYPRTPITRDGLDIDVEGNLAGTHTWYATNTYHLQGLVHVLSNAVLVIQPGTAVKGVNLGAAAIQKGGLVVCRGAKLYAQGTAKAPIIFTAEDDDLDDPSDLDPYQRGLWGGVVIMGQARINAATTAAGNAANPKYEVFEGLPDTVVSGEFVNRYGGAKDDDSSGALRYVSIRHGGAVIEANKELNGLSICAAGSGTVLEYIETYAFADDGFEFFGGTANTKYLVSAFNDDDCFDTDQGYSGKNQFWFAIQAPDRRNYGMELNGEPNGLTGATPLLPYSNFQVYNATLIGAGTASIGVGGDNTALKIREYSAPRLYNSIITDFARRGIEIDAKSGVMEDNGLLQLCNNLWWGFGTSANPNSVTNICVDARAQYYFTNASWANLILDPMLTGISRTTNGGLNPSPLPGSPAYTGARAVPADGFFCQVGYQGAFGASDTWAQGWTALSEYNILGAGNPCPPTSPPPTLGFARGEGVLNISFATDACFQYQLQSTTNLNSPIIWANEGAAVPGTGNPVTNSVPIGPGFKFFQLSVE